MGFLNSFIHVNKEACTSFTPNVNLYKGSNQMIGVMTLLELGHQYGTQNCYYIIRADHKILIVTRTSLNHNWMCKNFENKGHV